jgi:hypothetical protein
MWPLLLLAVVGYYFWTKTSEGQIAGIVPTMHHGVTYAFEMVTPLDALTLASELATVGAIMVGLPMYSPSGSTQGSLVQGVFAWEGVDGEPTEHLPNITWLSLNPTSIQTLPGQTTVSGSGLPMGAHMLAPAMGDVHARHEDLMMYLGGPGPGGGCSR